MTDPEFVRYDVAGLYSISHLFPRGAARKGVYILHFASGERLVGHSIDMVGRFARSRQRWADIQFLDFAPVPVRDLTATYLSVARRHDTSGVMLWAEAESRDYAGERDIDEHISVADQIAWLDGDFPLFDVSERSIDQHQRGARCADYEALIASGESALVAALAADYVGLCVPRPRETERVFWSLTAAGSMTPIAGSQQLAAVNVGSLDTFVVRQDHFAISDPGLGLIVDEWLFSGSVIVSPSVLQRHLPLELIGSAGSLLTLDEAARYPELGADQAIVHFIEAAGFNELIELPGMVEAAREVVLRMMRQGPAKKWQSHNYLLADDAFSLLGAVHL